MASKLVLEPFFKSGAYAASLKRGEMITSVFARLLVEQSKLVPESKVHPGKPLVVLDNACGTGIVSSILNEKLDPAIKQGWTLTCGDISPAVLEYTQRRSEDEGWQNAETKIVDAQNPELPSAFYTHVFTAFAYMALPESIKGLDETVRILSPGGKIAFSTWIEPGWVPVARRVIQSMPGNLPFPGSTELMAIMNDGEWHSVSWIESQLEQRGFEDIEVQVTPIKITLQSALFVDMAVLMLPIMMNTFWSKEQRETNQDKVRAALENYVEDTYGKDGDVETEWVAILSTARKSN